MRPWFGIVGEATPHLTTLGAGSLFAGYRIEGLLARGGMGVVYKATDVDLDRTVALKIIAPEYTQNAEAVARFKSEARLAASLEHPNIVPIHRGGEFDGVLYLAMRLVPGTNLRELIDRGPLAMDRIERIITQVADALDVAHQSGLVHRDVKPANILISGEGEGEHEHVYLTDFGLTKRLGSAGSLTRTGTWVGTPDYVAPEQIQDGSVDGRTDVYALGCVLYEMLTGSVAFPRDTDVAKLWAHVSDSPPPPSIKRPELVKAFDEVVARATAKDPDQRYAKPSELAAAVHRAMAEQKSKLAGDVIEETGTGPIGQLGRTAAGAGLTVPSASRDETFIAAPTHAPGEPARDEKQGAAAPPPQPPAGDQQTGRREDDGSRGPGWLVRHRWLVAGGLALACGIAAVVVLSGSSKKASLGEPVAATLAPVPTNHVNGNGNATVRLKGNVATVTLHTTGLLTAPHAMHIHAGALGQCPPASAARLHNGNLAISTSNGGAFYGHPRASLTTRGDTSVASILAFSRYPATGDITYSRTFRLTPATARYVLRNNAVIVVHGIDYNGNGIYDGTLDRSELNHGVQGETTAPALCGPLVRSPSARGTAQKQGPAGTRVYTASLTIQAAAPVWLCDLRAVTS